MRFQLILLFIIIVVTSCAKKDHPPFRKMGDYAPPLHIREWVKGTPVQNLEEGKVYVLEFWATWCKPCLAGMPHLSALANEYKGKVTFLAIDVYEEKGTSIEQIRAVVDSLGSRMDLNVAVQDSNLMADKWLVASGEKNNGIPRTIVVDAQGRVAWTGHPSELNKVLPKIVSGVWVIKEELDKRANIKQLDSLGHEFDPRLSIYAGALSHIKNPRYRANPDSVLIVYDEIIKKEPKLRYAPALSDPVFSALLQTNPHKAFEFGKKLIKAQYGSYDNSYDTVIYLVERYSKVLNLPAEIYLLCAEAYQMRINAIVYPELIDMSEEYRQLAEYYHRGGDKSKAVEAEKKAVKFTANN